MARASAPISMATSALRDSIADTAMLIRADACAICSLQVMAVSPQSPHLFAFIPVNHTGV